MSVFSSKKCVEEITSPVHGQIGFRRNPDAKGGLEELVYDKGGNERGPRDARGRGGSLAFSPSGWVTLAEHARRKEARSRHWKKVDGPRHHQLTSRRRSDLEMRGGVDAYYYGGSHPHEGSSFVVTACVKAA